MKLINKIVGLILLFLLYALIAQAEEIPGVVGPFTLTDFLQKNYTYQAEKGLRDHWKTPEETIKDKGGDCEDFAILTLSYLKQWGYNSHMVLLQSRKLFGFGHAVTVFELFNGEWAVFDNQYLLYYNASTLEEALKIYRDEYEIAYLITPNKEPYKRFNLPKE